MGSNQGRWPPHVAADALTPADSASRPGDVVAPLGITVTSSHQRWRPQLLRLGPDCESANHRMRRLVACADNQAMYYQDHMDGTNWVAMSVAMVFLLVVVVLVLWAITGWPRLAGHSAPQSTEAGTTSARDLLDGRMARGEIDVDEYQQRRNALDRTR